MTFEEQLAWLDPLPERTPAARTRWRAPSGPLGDEDTADSGGRRARG